MGAVLCRAFPPTGSPRPHPPPSRAARGPLGGGENSARQGRSARKSAGRAAPPAMPSGLRRVLRRAHMQRVLSAHPVGTGSGPRAAPFFVWALAPPSRSGPATLARLGCVPPESAPPRRYSREASAGLAARVALCVPALFSFCPSRWGERRGRAAGKTRAASVGRCLGGPPRQEQRAAQNRGGPAKKKNRPETNPMPNPTAALRRGTGESAGFF